MFFSNETMIELRPKCEMVVRRPYNFDFDPLFTPKIKKSASKKLMIWGCVRSNNERFIFLIKNKVDANVYIDCLKNKVLLFLNLNEVSQQDNTTTHMAEKTVFFLRRMSSHYWKTGQHTLRT